jgi:Cd2+/Zn2+-exporting ATPase
VSALTSAARHGVLIKGGEHLEALGRIQALAVDKTGTLTTGELRVADTWAADGAEGQLLRRVAAVQVRSEHPVGRAIVRLAEERGIRSDLPVEEFTAVPGRGVCARVDGWELRVGVESFVVPGGDVPWGGAEPGTALVFARTEDGLRGVFTIRDELRPVAPRVIARLHALGVRPIVMLTGDDPTAANAVGHAAGVDEVRARLLPEQKVEAVRTLRDLHGEVAMLGDGVNDAAALAAATVGIAMGAAGSPATIETADVALMGDDLTKLPYVIRLARRTRKTIRFSIALALVLKLSLAIGAVLGVVSLAVAVLVGDMGGSLAVTGNALWLARMRSDR